MSLTRRSPRGSVRLAAARVGCLAIAAASLAGLLMVAPPAPAASASDATGSAVSIAWADATGSTSAFQPARVTTDAAYAGFKNLAVSVDQTADVGDQAIRVTVTGFAKTLSVRQQDGTIYSDAMNFMQAMQCWGPDPLAADFASTCQWGGRYVANNGLGNSVFPDNTLRVAAKDAAPDAVGAKDVPFLLADATNTTMADNTSITGRQIEKKDDAGKTSVIYPLLDYFNPATTNEVQSARISADGTGVFDFETQSAEQAPQLGCGSPDHLRCWLVLVPRGTTYAGNDDSCSGIRETDLADTDPRFDTPYSYGRKNSIQAGSPVNASCGYWNNRVSVPLDFSPVGSTCAIGNTERRVIGSQLLVNAMASWQPDLCHRLSTTYSFAANPDSVARIQLIERQAGLAFGSFPVTAGSLDNDADRTALSSTNLSTAPVAIASTVVAFVAEGSNGRQTRLSLSPRLMAKLLTQSYIFTVPSNSSDPSKNFAHLAATNRSYGYLNQDPDFQAMNANWREFTTNPAVLLSGPAGADAIRQLWRWILADTEAKSWIAGAADPWGMLVNPFYLPKGDVAAQVPAFTEAGEYAKNPDGSPAFTAVGLSNLDGSPEKLSETTLDSLPKYDQSLAPLALSVEKNRFGSLQFAPYTDTFATAAHNAFRADPNSKTVWDPTRINAAGVIGDWVSSGAQVPGQKFMIAITDAASAARYSLNTAALRLDNASTFGSADSAGMASALSALAPTEVAAVTQIDPAKVTGTGYPLTTVVYATVNLSSADKPALTDFSGFLNQVTTTGQVPGTANGQLPIGYLPITAEMATQAKAAAAAIAAYVPELDAASSAAPLPVVGTTGIAQDTYERGTIGAAPLSDSPRPVAAEPAGTGASTAAIAAVDAGVTPAAPEATIGRAGLVLSLGGGLSGALFAPLLFRGRRFS